MVYEYEITCVEGLFVVSAMGRPQISFTTLVQARSLLHEIAALPFQAVSYWPNLETERDALIVAENADAPALFKTVPPTAILIELDHQALRVETSQETPMRQIKLGKPAVIRGFDVSLEVGGVR